MIERVSLSLIPHIVNNPQDDPRVVPRHGFAAAWAMVGGNDEKGQVRRLVGLSAAEALWLPHIAQNDVGLRFRFCVDLPAM